MNIIRSSTIGRKLGVGFFLITVLLTCIGIISIYTVSKLSSFTEQLYKHPYEVSNTTRNIQIEVMKIELTLREILSEGKHINNGDNIRLDEYKSFDIKVAISTIDRAEQNINREFEIMFQRYLGEQKDIKNAFNIFKSWKPIRDKVINLLREEKQPEAEEVMYKIGASYHEKIYDSMYEMMSFSDTKAEGFYQNVIKKKTDSFITLFAFIILSIISAITISIIITNDIRTPLNQLLLITEKISKGDLDISVTKEEKSISERDDEIGALYRSFETIISFLALPYHDVIKSNRNLKEKTGEISRLLNSFNEHVIASKTDCNGRIVYISDAFAKASGFSKAELIGSMQNIVRQPDNSKELYKEIWKTIRSGKSWTGEIKNKTKDGGFFWIHAHISPDIDSNGNTIGYNAINQDITAQKELEELSQTLEHRVTEEITKNKQQASHMLQQSRLAQMGEMISMIAHQWRQPLASISAVAGTLSIDVQLDDYKKEFFHEKLEAISDLAIHLSSTINDFRSFFKEDKEEEETSVKNIIDSSLQIISPSFTTNNIIIENNSEEEILLKTYPNEVKQVLLNLLKNSEEAIEDKGIDEGKIWIQSYKKDNTAYICVEDNAGGISKEILEKVFDPYFSTKTKKDGTGLGLYMSKTIIEEHCKGHLHVYNTERGALFEITLSLKEEKTL